MGPKGRCTSPDNVVGNDQCLGVAHSADHMQRPHPVRIHHVLLHLRTVPEGVLPGSCACLATTYKALHDVE